MTIVIGSVIYQSCALVKLVNLNPAQPAPAPITVQFCRMKCAVVFWIRIPSAPSAVILLF